MIRIARSHTYRHRNCTEVDMHVVRLLYFNSDWFRLEVAWVNRHNPLICIPDTVRIWRKDLGNWIDLGDTKSAGVAQG